MEPCSYGYLVGVNAYDISLGILIHAAVIHDSDGRQREELETAAVLIAVNAEAVVKMAGDENYVIVLFKYIFDLLALYAY